MQTEPHIEENGNYPANVFLMNGSACIGEARLEMCGLWSVTVSQLYDPITDTDCRFGWAGNREQAVVMLKNEGV